MYTKNIILNLFWCGGYPLVPHFPKSIPKSTTSTLPSWLMSALGLVVWPQEESRIPRSTTSTLPSELRSELPLVEADVPFTNAPISQVPERVASAGFGHVAPGTGPEA